MEYWTVMWITVLSGALDGSTSGLVYQSLEKCEAAREVVISTLDYDFNVDCQQSGVPSVSIRPLPRPFFADPHAMITLRQEVEHRGLLP